MKPIKSEVILSVIDEYGNVVRQVRTTNVVTDEGDKCFVERLKLVPSKAFVCMNCGTNSGVASKTNTALGNEFTTPRVLFADGWAPSVTSKTAVFRAIFPSTYAVGTIRELGLFDSTLTSAGSYNILARAVLAAPINKSSSEEVALDWTYTANL
jgi:hypothetical protein